MSIAENLKILHTAIPSGIKLLCVSKFHPSEMIMEAYNQGERCFGESRPQEFQQKASALPGDIEWHFIGNLQTNKVKMVVPYAALIQSVANIRLFDEIEKEAKKIDKVQDILVELHVASEESKSGFSPDEVEKVLTKDFLSSHPHVRIRGVMGMATLTDDETLIRKEFIQIKETYEQLRSSVFAGEDYFCEVSMGMSDDYALAIKEGATIIRIGSKIFGTRNY